MKTLVFSSNNSGKIREVRAIFNGSNFSVVPQSEVNINEGAEETACTFIENALLKARFVASQVNYPVIAEDSGLVIDLLDNKPGVVSARYAGTNASDQENIDKIITELQQKDISQSPAGFIAIVVYISNPNDPIPLVLQGEMSGIVSTTCRGNNGFGYDPMFYPTGMELSLAEMTQEQKNSISHRGIAFRKLLQSLNSLSIP